MNIEFTTNQKYSNNPILKHSFEFALLAVRYSELLDSKNKYVISKQLLRSGTSIGANIKEAQNAESKNNFIHKMKIASKEADEMEYWLFLCKNLHDYPSVDEMLVKLQIIMKMLNRIISTTKSNL